MKAFGISLPWGIGERSRKPISDDCAISEEGVYAVMERKEWVFPIRLIPVSPVSTIEPFPAENKSALEVRIGPALKASRVRQVRVQKP